jgi:hypothetical protein
MQQEMIYPHKMKGMGWKDFNGENPYLERYGEENWEAELKKAPAMRKYS